MSPQPITVLQEWPGFISLIHFLYRNPQILHKHFACAECSGRPTLLCVFLLVLYLSGIRRTSRGWLFFSVWSCHVKTKCFIGSNVCTVKNLCLYLFLLFVLWVPVWENIWNTTNAFLCDICAVIKPREVRAHHRQHCCRAWPLKEILCNLR